MCAAGTPFGPYGSFISCGKQNPPLFPPELSDRANARREINQSKSQAFHRNGFCNMTFSEDITHSSLEKLQRNPNPTYIDLEAAKAAKRLAESRCQDVTFTVVIPAGLRKTHTNKMRRGALGL